MFLHLQEELKICVCVCVLCLFWERFWLLHLFVVKVCEPNKIPPRLQCLLHKLSQTEEKGVGRAVGDMGTHLPGGRAWAHKKLEHTCVKIAFTFFSHFQVFGSRLPPSISKEGTRFTKQKYKMPSKISTSEKQCTVCMCVSVRGNIWDIVVPKSYAELIWNANITGILYFIWQPQSCQLFELHLHSQPQPQQPSPLSQQRGCGVDTKHFPAFEEKKRNDINKTTLFKGHVMRLLWRDNLWTKMALEDFTPGWTALEDHLFPSFFQ